MPIAYEIAGALARYGLVMLSTWLVQRHIITSVQGEKFTADVLNHIMLALPGVAAVAWMVWAKIKTKIRYNTSLWEAKMTDKDVREKVAAGQGMGVATLVVLLAAGLAATGCASRAPTPAAVVADVATKIQQSANVVLHEAVAANATIVPSTGKPLISRPQLDVVALAVNKVGRSGLILQSALEGYASAKASGKDLSAAKATVFRAIADIESAMNLVGASIPAGTARTLDQAVNTVFTLLVQLKAGEGL